MIIDKGHKNEDIGRSDTISPRKERRRKRRKSFGEGRNRKYLFWRRTPTEKDKEENIWMKNIIFWQRIKRMKKEKEENIWRMKIYF